mmetsp:Transcript_21546/g.61774  ORF Transcript_21546/g.61774 Transcript_21546/m.61774 type:complete len:263 (+) Transcript_21546:82-870(+)
MVPKSIDPLDLRRGISSNSLSLSLSSLSPASSARMAAVAPAAAQFLLSATGRGIEKMGSGSVSLGFAASTVASSALQPNSALPMLSSSEDPVLVRVGMGWSGFSRSTSDSVSPEGVILASCGKVGKLPSSPLTSSALSASSLMLSSCSRIRLLRRIPTRPKAKQLANTPRNETRPMARPLIPALALNCSRLLPGILAASKARFSTYATPRISLSFLSLAASLRPSLLLSPPPPPTKDPSSAPDLTMVLIRCLAAKRSSLEDR